MATILRNTPKRSHARKQLSMDSPVASVGVTLSLSQTSNREEVSWSSSDGSTYYSEDEASLQQRKQTRPMPSPGQDVLVSPVRSNNCQNDCQPSKSLKETSPGSKDFHQRKTARVPPCIDPKKKKKLTLENVENFPAIDIATDNEDVSAVGFLTTEDAAEVFCTGSIPFEVTTSKKLYEKMSAMSSSSTVESSVDSSDSESDEKSRKHKEKHDKWIPTDSERATIRNQGSDVSDDESSVLTIDKHSVVGFSVSYQDPVSSLECPSTLNELSLGSDTSEDESSTDDKPPLQKTRNTPVHTRNTVTAHQIDSKVNRIKLMKRKKSDLKTDERIKQLKAKIKSIQNLSMTNMTVSSSEGESNLSSSLQPMRIKGRKTAKHEDKMNDDKSDPAEPSMNRYESRASQQQNKSIPTKNFNRSSFEADKSLVGTMIPVVEREEISILRFDASAREVRESDIEEGQFRTSKCEKRISISDHTKVLLSSGKTKVLLAYGHLQPIIERQRTEFLRKPRYEQILIISIGAMISIFLILLFVMIS